MKIRLEAQKTSLRLSKPQFQTLLAHRKIESDSLFPDGTKLSFSLELGSAQSIKIADNQFHFVLPSRDVEGYKPDKSGLSFIFQIDKKQNHELVFEVDIKKPPLGSRRRNTSSKIAK